MKYEVNTAIAQKVTLPVLVGAGVGVSGTLFKLAR